MWITGLPFVGGVTLKQLDDEAFRCGLSFPPHPGAESATVGGMIATNAGGVRALKYGTMRNYVLGLEVVLADGRILNLGGKTIKNSSGYPLLQLFAGSEGTLGVITKANIRLFPQMAEMTALAIPFPTMEQAMGCVVEVARKMLPLALEFMERRAVEIGERVSGERWVSSDGEAHLLMISRALTRLRVLLKLLKGMEPSRFMQLQQKKTRTDF